MNKYRIENPNNNKVREYKSRTTETGYQYFGARYQSPKLSIWLSVDPLSDKYPSTSSYAYCRNNPVILIDPNGMNDDGWQIDLKENTVTKVNHLGGDKQQHVSFTGGTKDVSTYDMSTSEFISKNKKLGLEVSDNTNMNTNNITSELGSQITGIGLSLTSEVLENNTLKNPKLNSAGKLLGKGLFGIGIALDTKNTINVLNSDMSNSSKLYETGKTATPYALTFLFGSTIGGLSAPAIIAADMAWEGMKQIYSNIDNWGRNLPNQIINSH